MNSEVPQATDEAQMRAFWRKWNELITTKKQNKKKKKREGKKMNVTRQRFEDFLYKEAEILDEWEMQAWAALFSAEGTYEIPPIGNPDADFKKSLIFSS